ncbi:MAG TPA: ACT domain-containing protein [Alphaproteobacteria bacterium]|jgi:hypothetical protein|nr:ACT domain-containing protein [Alphaproteobacteria bacterium]
MPETDLATLIRAMSPRLLPGLFVFVTVDTAPAGLDHVMTFREAEGITLILPQDQAVAAGLDGTFPSRMITLDVQSSLDAIGFLAAITGELAEAGIPVNPVSGFHHDHLFVPENRALEAMAILLGMASPE